MLSFINKAVMFFRSKRIYVRPKKSDLLIYDACGEKYLLDILSSWKPITLHVNGESINMPILFSSLFSNLFARRKMSSAYIDCYIRSVQPKIIITFIDNSTNFYLLSKRHSGIKTIFLQNGWRGYYGDCFELLHNMEPNVREKMQVDYMMTFGTHTGELFSKYLQGKILPCGSIKNNNMVKEIGTQKNLIVFISQWYKDSFVMDDRLYTHWEFFGQADQPILTWVNEYARANNKKLVIVPRVFADKDLRPLEQAYYENILGDDAEFLDLEAKYPAYQAIDMADVVITVDSTLGYESIARGNKTAFFSIRSSLLNIPGLTCGWPNGLPDEGLFWSNYLNTYNFTRIFDYLFSVSYEEWKEDINKAGFASLMQYDPGNKTLNAILEKELGYSSCFEPYQFQPGLPDKSRVN